MSTLLRGDAFFPRVTTRGYVAPFRAIWSTRYEGVRFVLSWGDSTVQERARAAAEEFNRRLRALPKRPPDPICPKCYGRQGYPNSQTQPGAPHPCLCR